MSAIQASNGHRTLHAALWALLSVAACGQAVPEGATGREDDVTTPARASYRMRGLVRGVDGGELTVHHEPVPDLVGPTGTVEAMGAMTMSFPVAPSIELERLAAGDKVAFVLEVDWGAEVPALVSEVSSLPPDTELDFD